MAASATRQALPAASAQPGQASTISVRGLTKTYGKRENGSAPALGPIDLDVYPGEFLVLLGPSGCGKTTLLRSIAGLETPDSGSIYIDGEPLFDSNLKIDLESERRPVSMIFQSYALWPHMTAGKNVAFPLKCHKVPAKEIPGRVADILETVGIGHLIDRYPSQMSGGEQQRLALARALVVGQRVVLFDEPLSNVDAQVREKLRVELIRMQREIGFTAIYVTHDQSEAMELADRIAIMRKGHISQLDQPEGMYTEPKSVHVARFLGQSNEVVFTVESYDAASGRVIGSGAVGRIVASWDKVNGGTVPQPGEELIAFGRPDDFHIAEPSRAKKGAENSWNGTIDAVRFLGPNRQSLVNVDTVRLRSWRPANEEGGLREGGDVTVTIRSEDLRAMRDAR